MYTGPMINWWGWGADDPIPPTPVTYYSANTGMAGIRGGDIDLISILLFIGASLC